MTLESGDIFTAHVDGNILVLQACRALADDEVASVCLVPTDVAGLLSYEDADTTYLSAADILRCEDDHYKLIFDDHPVTFNRYEWKLFIEAVKSQAWRFLQ